LCLTKNALEKTGEHASEKHPPKRQEPHPNEKKHVIVVYEEAGNFTRQEPRVEKRQEPRVEKRQEPYANKKKHFVLFYEDKV
jgi:hypothetical protein